MISRRAVLASATLLPFAARAAGSWEGTLAAARGGTVYFNAWAGDDATNAFVAWAGERLRMLHDVTLRHVRLSDTGEAVARVIAERAAGRTEGGSVDLIWINGPNFLSMKKQGLLFGPALDLLPNAGLVDRTGKPATVSDFAEPTDGFEIPWRMAQVVFIVDAARAAAPPRTMAAMVDWAHANPGRLTHPTARDFMGATFLKQALVELAPDRAALQTPASDATYDATVAPLWAWYDALRPNLWRKGADFPASGPAQARLLEDGEIDLFISFNPAEAANGIARGTMAPTVRAYVLDGGTIGNCSFVAIPFNAAHRDAALVTADFLLSPEAQSHAADARYLGSPTVLAVGQLSAADRALFEQPGLPGSLSAAELGQPLLEPHASWMTRIADQWERRTRG